LVLIRTVPVRSLEGTPKFFFIANGVGSCSDQSIDALKLDIPIYGLTRHLAQLPRRSCYLTQSFRAVRVLLSVGPLL
jgi:hypothetical protein